MEPEILYHRRRFNTALEPIKVMLIDKKRKMTLVNWLKFVEHTRTSVINNPDQYLGPNLPQAEVLQRIIGDIFSQFLKAEA